MAEKKTKVVRVDSLNGRDNNPRKPWTSQQEESFLKSLNEFGDLSGVIKSRKTEVLIGGHKRVDAFKEDPGAKVVLTDTYRKPDKTGTMAYGYIELSSGTRFAYREVRWDEDKEKAAVLAANRWGAEWELSSLSNLLDELGTGDFDLELTGFNGEEITQMLSDMPSLDTHEVKTAPTDFPEYDEDIETKHECPKCGYEWS